MEKTIDGILKKRIKKDSYFKVKSGPFLSTKIDNDQEVDSTAQDSVGITPEDYAKKQLGMLKHKGSTLLFEEQNWVLPFLDKPNKYMLTNEGIVYDQEFQRINCILHQKNEKITAATC